MPPAAPDNYRACLAGRGGVVCQGVVETEHSWWERVAGACEVCKREVVLHGFTNTRDCGADYNGSGQLLDSARAMGRGNGREHRRHRS